MVVVGVALWVVPADAKALSSASNGEATKSAETILADAKAATKASASVAISGTAIDKGKRFSFNIVSSRGGAGGGTITSGGATFTIVVSPPKVYLKADKASWNKLSGSPAAGQLFADKWFQTTTANRDFRSFAGLVDSTKLTQRITANDSLTKGAVTTFHGRKAVPLRDGTDGTLYVAATGTPYILGLVGTGAQRGSQILFSDYGSAKVPSAPTNVISLSQLQEGSGGSQ